MIMLQINIFVYSEMIQIKFFGLYFVFIMIYGSMYILNAFFVYFTMLKGMQREESWQKGFLLACIVQILIEVFSYCVLLFPFVA